LRGRERGAVHERGHRRDVVHRSAQPRDHDLLGRRAGRLADRPVRDRRPPRPSRRPRVVRVIAGHYGGRTLRAPPGTATRPTSDRVREALFSILGTRVHDARVLDLFAGSGALGIEALSRGAREATFVDAGVAAIRAIKENLKTLGAWGEIRKADALKFLARDGQYDLVFLDPPYK